MYREGCHPFRETDRAFLNALYPHIRNLSIRILQPEVARKARAARLFRESGFSKREAEIAALLLERVSVSDVAELLFLSRRTVEKHLEHIYSRLRVRGGRTVFDQLASEAARLNPAGWSTRALDPTPRNAGSR